MKKLTNNEDKFNYLGFVKEVSHDYDENDKKAHFKRMVDYYIDVADEARLCVCFFYESKNCRDNSWVHVETSCNLSINDEFMELRYTSWEEVDALYLALTGKELEKNIIKINTNQ
jgi:hypothetical protein